MKKAAFVHELKSEVRGAAAEPPGLGWPGSSLGITKKNFRWNFADVEVNGEPSPPGGDTGPGW